MRCSAEGGEQCRSHDSGAESPAPTSTRHRPISATRLLTGILCKATWGLSHREKARRLAGSGEIPKQLIEDGLVSADTSQRGGVRGQNDIGRRTGKPIRE